jgi:pSer/pThr/pTyr-binding forkhead associated (FHA) protein
VISGVRSRRVELAADRSTVGRARENDIGVDDDATAGGLHAVLERFAAGWTVTDLGSSNGMWVNGERIRASRRLRHGDEIRIGHTRLVFHDPLTAAGEHVARGMFTEPASTRAIADELVITRAAVKQHRAALADEALGRGAVSLTELRESDPE